MTMTPAPTSPATTPDLSDYEVIHTALRTAPHRIAAALTDFADGDRPRATALARYWEGYAGEVLAHHTVEDSVFFPALIARVPVVADHLARVDVEHHRLDELMAACEQAFAELGASATANAATDAAAVVRELARLMDGHLDFEDADLVPLFGRHFTAEEYDAMTQQAMKQLGIGKQAAFTVPFVMYWASPAQGQKLLGEAPLPMRILFRLTRGRHARLTSLALGRSAAPQAVAL